jgi:tRNA-dihydrouridine synthase C
MIQVRHGVPALVMAPMEGVTDSPMRALLSRIGGFDFCVTEFIRVSHGIPGVRTFQTRIPELLDGARTPAGLPVQVQILGGDPDRLALAARAAVEAGAPAVDLNFGCPAKTVNRHDGGASLLLHPDRIRTIVAAVRTAVPPHVPVSAKLRLGWDDPDAIHVNAGRAVEGGASWITIHGRTKAQGYRPPANWGAIGDVRARAGIPVVANGEIWTVDDLRRCRDETDCEHFMLGRGVIADPFLALRAANEMGIRGLEPVVFAKGSPRSWLPLVKEFVGLYAKVGWTPAATAARVKQWLNMANHDGQLPWFDSLKRSESLDELLECLDELAGLRRLAVSSGK